MDVGAETEPQDRLISGHGDLVRCARHPQHAVRHGGDGVRVEGFEQQYRFQLNDTHPAVAVPELMRLLRQAYNARPDAEIAAHLGEVLWTLGQRDKAQAIWREGMMLNAENETLLETLRRLKVQP